MQPIPRPAARILVLDRAGRVLMFRFDPPDRPAFWCTPGGALDSDESYETAARRELFEETGIVSDPGAIVAQRSAEFETIEGAYVIAEERYFLVQLDADERDAPIVDTRHHTELEKQVMRSWRWFDRAEVQAVDELFYPADVFAMIDAAHANANKV